MMGVVGFQLPLASSPAETSMNIQNNLKIHQICIHRRQYVRGFILDCVQKTVLGHGDELLENCGC
jgi:hypothetical protein